MQTVSGEIDSVIATHNKERSRIAMESFSESKTAFL